MCGLKRGRAPAPRILTSHWLPTRYTVWPASPETANVKHAPKGDKIDSYTTLFSIFSPKRELRDFCRFGHAASSSHQHCAVSLPSDHEILN